MKDESKKKNLIIGVLVFIIVSLLAALIYFIFIKKEDKNIDSIANCQNNAFDLSKTKESSYDILNGIKLVSTYEDEKDGIKIYLYDDGTYHYIVEDEIQFGSFGTYSIDNNTIYLNKIFVHGNGSGIIIVKNIESSKYTVKNDGLYDVTSGTLKYKKIANNDNINAYRLFERLYDYLSSGDNLCLSEADGGIYIDSNCR